ncbi:hypothetical protein FO519_001257 [Halicephalobus sp. NKZ332]|nr:hypothetical protein FO519_001257 [Halicephalobus sp. NKZ332]
MPRSEKELNDLIRKIQDEFEALWKAGDAKKLADLYHPEAVLVCTSAWVAYGRKAIEEKYVPLVGPNFNFKLIFDQNLEAGDGEYLIHKGRFAMEDKPGVFLPYEQIFKRQSDGSYLIYHDEFSLGN